MSGRGPANNIEALGSGIWLGGQFKNTAFYSIGKYFIEVHQGKRMHAMHLFVELLWPWTKLHTLS